MILEIKIPSPGESITEVELVSWFVEDGAMVDKNQEIGEVESEKATLPLIAEQSGRITITAPEGSTVSVGDVVASIDTSVEGSGSGAADAEEKPAEPEAQEEPGAATADTAEKPAEPEAQEPGSTTPENPAEPKEAEPRAEKPQEKPAESRAEKPQEKPAGARGTGSAEPPVVPPAPINAESAGKQQEAPVTRGTEKAYENVKVTPVARKMMDEEGLSVEDIINGLRKITAGDVGRVLEQRSTAAAAGAAPDQPGREENRSKVSQLRKKISERLVAVKNETAMLTTFNEADMSAVISLRKKYQQEFVEKYGIKVGFMSFFTKAVTLALRQFPSVNSYLDEGEVVTPAYCDIGIAVQTDKGLMVPVLRNTESLSLAEIEKQIAELAGKARKARLSIEEMSGGTFTISNGGIYGSMLSTPILNPPQSAILGMHNIVERPVVLDGKVEIRPIMYLALSYDHRVIDGRDSVSFLKAVKEYIEDPVRMVFGERSPEAGLLDI